MQDTRGLYKVFSVDDSTSGQPPESEILEKNVDDGARPSAMANQSPDPPSHMADQPQDPPSSMANRSLDPLLEDYLELNDLDIPLSQLNDLDIPLSRSTSSADSSCMTMSSEEFFDSDALMRELGDDPVDQEIRDPRINFNLSAPAKLKEVIMHPTTIVPTGSVNGGLESKPSKGQPSRTDPTPRNKPENHKKATTSNNVDDTTASSSSSEGSSKEEKRNRAKKRKMLKYLCFLAF